MIQDTETQPLSQALHNLFKYVFVKNCELDEEAVTSEEEKTLEELDPLETLENLKDVVLSLLKFKKKHKTSDLAEMISQHGQFEIMLQKLEGDIRNHIKIEHQLKLHIDASQSKVEELESGLERANAIIKKLEKKQDKNMHGKYVKSLDKSYKIKNDFDLKSQTMDVEDN